jgi:hypothetical protein
VVRRVIVQAGLRSVGRPHRGGSGSRRGPGRRSLRHYTAPPWPEPAAVADLPEPIRKTIRSAKPSRSNQDKPAAMHQSPRA